MLQQYSNVCNQLAFLLFCCCLQGVKYSSRTEELAGELSDHFHGFVTTYVV